MCTTFPRFPDLAAELRRSIWAHALDAHAAHVFAAARIHCSTDSDDDDDAPFDDGESVLVVDCPAISAACREARDVRLTHLRHQRRRPEPCFAYVSESWHDPFSQGPVIMLSGAKHLCGSSNGDGDGDGNGIGNGGSEDCFLYVLISGGRFRSAQHLVAIVAMLFGNSVQRIHLDFAITDLVSETLCVSPLVYWPEASFFEFDRADKYPEFEHQLRDVFDDAWQEINDQKLFVDYDVHVFVPEDDGQVTALMPPNGDHLIALYPDLRMRYSHPVGGIDQYMAMHLFRMRDLFLAADGVLPRLSRLDVVFDFYDQLSNESDEFQWLRLGCARDGHLFCCWMSEWPDWTFNWR